MIKVHYAHYVMEAFYRIDCIELDDRSKKGLEKSNIPSAR